MDAHNSILVDLSRLPSRQARLVNTSVLMDASSQHLELALIIEHTASRQTQLS